MIEQDLMVNCTFLIAISPPKQRLVPMPSWLGNIREFPSYAGAWQGINA
jgi:hypothetical protein